MSKWAFPAPEDISGVIAICLGDTWSTLSESRISPIASALNRLLKLFRLKKQHRYDVSEWYLVIVLTKSPAPIDWMVVKDFVDNPLRIKTTDLGDRGQPWVYRAGGYFLGLMFGWLELLTAKKLEKVSFESPIPEAENFLLV